MTLLTYLQENLAMLMRRRDRLALNAVRSAISAIQNAETSYVSTPVTVSEASDFVAGAVRFGRSERIVTDLGDEKMMELARGEVTRRLDESLHYRSLGDVDRALTLKAEALALADKLDAYAA